MNNLPERGQAKQKVLRRQPDAETKRAKELRNRQNKQNRADATKGGKSK
jgi:hypothetical protein